MATKKAAAKKSAKKSAAKKSAAKKSTKKAVKKSGARRASGAELIRTLPTTLPGIPPPNLRCINACVAQFQRCISKGVDFATCQKRLVRCIQNCAGGGFGAVGDLGGDFE